MSSKGRRLVSLLFFCLMLVAGISAGVGAKETLTVYVPGNNVAIYLAYSEMAEKAAASLGYDIEVVTSTTWDVYFEKIAVHQASGMPVDIILVDDINAAMYLGSYMFRDLTPYVKADQVDLSQFFPAAVDIKRYKSQLMAIPVNVGVSVFYYNVDVVARFGLAKPPQDWNSSRWHWDDFVTDIRKATMDINGDGLMDQVGLARWTHPSDPWYWGTDFVSDDASSSNLNDPRVAQALNTTLQFYTEYSAVPGALSRVAPDVRTKYSFYTGQAMLLGGLDCDAAGYQAAVKSGANADINAAIFPKALERHTSFNSWGWAIGASSQNPEAAWEVIKILTLDRNFIAEHAAVVQRLPALRSVVPVVIGSLMQSAPIDWNVILGALTDDDIVRINRWYFNKNGSVANQMIVKMLSNITSGSKSVQEALAETHGPLDSVLKEGAW
ncbi:MAG: ABC transporter substrate-binding protein [Limnochordia bacterium]|jgi:ABC-type glycerol-3-phosphate transport system substrate-binding protein